MVGVAIIAHTLVEVASVVHPQVVCAIITCPIVRHACKAAKALAFKLCLQSNTM